MNAVLEDRKARILKHLATQGQGGFYDFPVAPCINDNDGPEAWFDAWAELEKEGRIEPVRGAPTDDLRLARFRIKSQMRLL